MKLSAEIQRGRVIISDGAMGTMLQERGMPTGICPEMMNIEMPKIVKGITADYIKARARLVETNTFGANRFILEKYGLADRLTEINAAGVTLAKEASEETTTAGGDIMVFASLGPSGVFLEPLGNASREELAVAVREQVRAFKDAGADGVCVETMSDIIEAEVTVRAVKDTGLECIALMCFEKTPRGYYTMMGADIPRSVKALIDAGADIVGAGCGVGCDDMVRIAREIRTITNHPLAIHPNAGRPEYSAGRVTYPESPEVFAKAARELADIGVNVIGGCCGTTPEHIGAIVEALRGDFPSRLD